MASKIKIIAKKRFILLSILSIFSGSSYQVSARATVFPIIEAMIKISKRTCSEILQKNALNLLEGGIFSGIGVKFTITSFMSTQAFCLSDNRKFDPHLSFSLLNFEIITPTNNFSKKKEPKIMKKINGILIH